MRTGVAAGFVLALVIASVGGYFTGTLNSPQTTTTITKTATVTQAASSSTVSVAPKVPDKLTIGRSVGGSSFPTEVALELGLFKKYGLNVEVKEISTGLQPDALFSGSLTFAQIAHSGAMQLAQQRGTYLKLVHTLDYTGLSDAGVETASTHLMVPINSTITKLSDLKGKTIALTRTGTTLHAAMSSLLKKAGVDPIKDIRWVEIPVTDTGAAMVKHQVDAAITYEPFTTRFVKSHFGTVFKDPPIMPTTSLYTPLMGVRIPISGVYTTDQFVNNYPDAVRLAAMAYAEAAAWIGKNPQAAIPIIMKYQNVDNESAAAIFKGYFYRSYPTGYTDWRDLQPQMNVYTDFGILKAPVDLKQLVTLPWFTPT